MAVGAAIVAEQEDRGRLVRLKQVEADRDEQRAEAARHGEQDPGLRVLRLRHPQAGEDRDDGEQQHKQHDIAVEGAGRPLLRQAKRPVVRLYVDRAHLMSLPLF